jgi:hypothetical protein
MRSANGRLFSNTACALQALLGLLVVVAAVSAPRAEAQILDGSTATSTQTMTSDFEPEADDNGVANANGWGIAGMLQGMGRQEGVAIALQTPRFWDTIGMRVGFGFDLTSYPGNTAVQTGQTILVDLQYFPPIQDPEMFHPYLTVPLNTTFTGGDHGSNTAGFSYGLMLGVDMGYWMGRNSTEAVPRSFFVEGGLVHSDIEFNDPLNGRTDMYRGFLVRVGMRQ